MSANDSALQGDSGSTPADAAASSPSNASSVESVGVIPPGGLVEGTWPVLPGLAGHDSREPSPELLHQIDQEVVDLMHAWHRYPPIAKASRHLDIPLLEAMDYHFVGQLLLALVRTANVSAAVVERTKWQISQLPAFAGHDDLVSERNKP